MHSRSTSIDTLPYEVIDLIFDELELESNIDPSNRHCTGTTVVRALAACRLQCKRLDNVACPRLFRTIYLTNYREAGNHATCGDHRGCAIFLDLIKSNPKIISFVRSFSIITYAYRKRTRVRCIVGNIDKELSQILDRLTAMGQLTHFAFNAFKGSLVWGKYNQRISKSIEALCSIPSITRLDFRGILGLPGNITSDFNNLQELGIMYGVTFQNPVGMLSRPSTSGTPLKLLELCPKTMSYSSTLNAVRAMGRVNLFSNIETLRWTILSLEELLIQDDYLSNNQRRRAWDICLNSVKETVRILDVGHSLFAQWTEEMSWPSADNLSSIKCLEEIRLRILFTAHSSKDRPRTTPRIIHRFLRGKTPIPTVRVIHIRYQLPRHCRQISTPLLAYGWSGIKLDEFVLETYPGLQRLIMEFQPSPHPNQSLDSWEELKAVEGEELKNFMRKNLPRVVESAVLLRVITPQLEVFDM